MENTVTNGIMEWKLRKAPKSHWNKIAQFSHTHMNLSPLVDGRTGRPKTGLTKDQEKYFEKKLGLEENELSPRSKFWRDFFIKLDDQIHVLDLTDPEDELAFYFLKAHKFVAFGHEELKKNNKAIYVLYNDVDEAKVQVSKRNVKKEAYAKFNEMITSDMIDTLLVLGERIVSTDPDIIEAMMGRVVETKAKEFLDVVGDDNFKMKLFVFKCLHYDLINRGKGKDIKQVRLSYNDQFLGEGVDAAVAFLEKKANQEIYLALDTRLKTALAAGTLALNPGLTGYEVDKKVDELKSKPKSTTERKISSNAAKNKMKKGATGMVDKGSVVQEVTGEGTDSGDYGEAPEVL